MNPHARKLIPSSSMVVAVIALLVAMSGSAVAASLITGEQIKDGTIQTKDLSKKTRVKLASASGGERGPAGPSGQQGERGANGSAGQNGRDGVSQALVRRVENEVGAHSSGVAVAHCLSGEEAIGGGGSIDGVDALQQTAPASGEDAASEGSAPDGWLARAFNADDETRTITAFAVCVPNGD